MVSTGLTRARRFQAALALDPIPASKVQSVPLEFADGMRRSVLHEAGYALRAGTVTTMKKTKHDHLLISNYDNELLTIGLDLGDRTSITVL
jgi:hypothetical protein